jgi:hypothetical protein
MAHSNANEVFFRVRYVVTHVLFKGAVPPGGKLYSCFLGSLLDGGSVNSALRARSTAAVLGNLRSVNYPLLQGLFPGSSVEESFAAARNHIAHDVFKVSNDHGEAFARARKEGTRSLAAFEAACLRGVDDFVKFCSWGDPSVRFETDDERLELGHSMGAFFGGFAAVFCESYERFLANSDDFLAMVYYCFKSLRK